MKYDLVHNDTIESRAYTLDECVRFIAAWHKYHEGVPREQWLDFPYTLYLRHGGEDVATFVGKVALAFLETQLEYAAQLAKMFEGSK